MTPNTSLLKMHNTDGTGKVDKYTPFILNCGLHSVAKADTTIFLQQTIRSPFNLSVMFHHHFPYDSCRSSSDHSHKNQGLALLPHHYDSYPSRFLFAHVHTFSKHIFSLLDRERPIGQSHTL